MRTPQRFYYKGPFRCSLMTAVVTLAALLVANGAGAESDDLQPIFNGKDLSGWQVPEPNPFWRVVDGVLIGENDAAMKGHVLYTKNAYRDFIFETDARWSGEIDSGIMLRKPELQVQIGISRSLKKDMTCSFYINGQEKYPKAGQARDLEKYLKPGDWNRIRLEAKGDIFVVWLNGEKVVEYKDGRFPDAYPIGLQIHPGLKMKVEFRNIRLKDLGGHN
jgi:3-keto-disaccharide hydrolase